MTLYALSSLVNAITSLLMACLILIRNPRGSLNRSFLYFVFVIFLWMSFYFLWQTSTNASGALFWCQLLSAITAWIPSTFFHFSMALTNQVEKKRLQIYCYHFLSAVFTALSCTPFMVADVRQRLSFPFWPTAGKLYFLYVLYCGIIYSYALYLLYRSLKSSHGVEQQKIKYVFWGTLIAFIGGLTNWPLWYDIPIPPVGNILVSAYVVLIAYAIIKHRLMDIRLAVSSAGLFIGIYALALGIPFYLQAIGYHTFALWLAVILASGAPFIYSRLQKRVEEKLFKEERAYQDMLLKAGDSVTSKKTVEEIARAVVETFMHTMQIKGTAFYVLDGEDFVLKEKSGQAPDIKNHTAGTVALPIRRDGKSLALLLLGEKVSGQEYSSRDLTVLKVIADQIALALENALYFESLERTQQKLLESEKMATIGFLVGGLAHQLKNRLTPLVFNSEFAARKIESHRESHLPASSCDETLAYLQKISDGVQSSKEVINGILNYASDRETKSPISVKELINASIELISFKIKPETVVFDVNIPNDLPTIHGNFAQLQEVLFNIIDNAHYSMMEKKSLNGDPTYQPKITFTAEALRDAVQITITDNGLGIKEDHMKRLFTPLFSTKKESKSGHGLGLYMIKQIVEKNHAGTISLQSTYYEGVSIELALPS